MTFTEDFLTEDVRAYLDREERKGLLGFFRFFLFFLSQPGENKFRDNLVGIYMAFALVNTLFSTIRYGVM